MCKGHETGKKAQAMGGGRARGCVVGMRRERCVESGSCSPGGCDRISSKFLF